MIIGSVDYAFGSGVTVSTYVAWGETEQTGAVYDTDDATTPITILRVLLLVLPLL